VVALTLFLGLAVGQTARLQVPSSDEGKFLRALAEGYQNNRESFRQFTCTFRSSYGNASSSIEALQHLENEVASSGFWACDDEKVVFRLICKVPPVMSELVSPPDNSNVRYATANCASRMCLSDGNFSVLYSPDDGLASIDGPNVRPSSIDSTPFDMGAMGQGKRGWRRFGGCSRRS
jgi:hypothetical protein